MYISPLIIRFRMLEGHIIIVNESQDTGIRNLVRQTFENSGKRINLGEFRRALVSGLKYDPTAEVSDDMIAACGKAAIEESFRGKMYHVQNGVVYNSE